MHDHPAVAELRRCQQQLRATETELALERAKTSALRQQIERMEAVRHLSGRPLVPEQTAGDCDATWMPKPTKDVPTRGELL